VISALKVELSDWQKHGELALLLRHEVFVREQGVPVDLERDNCDPEAIHALVIDAQENPIATGRLLREGRIGRLAVARPYRGQGLGQRVLQALIDHAQRLGIQPLHLHAQVSAQSFYEKFGFRVRGSSFEEAGIEHVDMYLDETSAPIGPGG
jgi:predicted GNAT family N-acyltransferase